jgi:hypothetical protein
MIFNERENTITLLSTGDLRKNTGGALNTVAAGMNRIAIHCRART